MRESFVPWRNRQQARLWRSDRGDLVQRHVLPVGFDADGVEKVGRRLSAPDGSEFPAGAFERLLHGGARVFENLRYGAHWTRVPTRSPETALATAPFLWMLSTMSGSLFSAQSVIAV